jgi:hypothetical protein
MVVGCRWHPSAEFKTVWVQSEKKLFTHKRSLKRPGTQEGEEPDGSRGMNARGNQALALSRLSVVGFIGLGRMGKGMAHHI